MCVFKLLPLMQTSQPAARRCSCSLGAQGTDIRRETRTSGGGTGAASCASCRRRQPLFSCACAAASPCLPCQPGVQRNREQPFQPGRLSRAQPGCASSSQVGRADCRLSQRQWRSRRRGAPARGRRACRSGSCCGRVRMSKEREGGEEQSTGVSLLQSCATGMCRCVAGKHESKGRILLQRDAPCARTRACTHPTFWPCARE